MLCTIVYESILTKTKLPALLSGLVSSDRKALSSKLRGHGFKSRPGTVGGLATIIMWGAWPG